MLKEFIARLALVLFIIGMTSEAAPEDVNSRTTKQLPNPGSKDISPSIPGETAN